MFRLYDALWLQFLGPVNLYISLIYEDPIAHLPDSDHCWSYSFGSWPGLRPNQRVEAVVQRQRHEGLGTGGTWEVRGRGWKIKNGGRYGHAALPGREVWRRGDTRRVHCEGQRLQFRGVYPHPGKACG